MSGRDTQAIKAALVLQGGGARGAFTSGVLDVFMEHGLDFPYVIGTSAGALCACNYISGDKGRNRFVCTELLTDPKFVSVRNLLFKRTAFNFNYLFFTVPKDIYPFSEEKFLKDERPFFAACTSMKTGEAIYFDKRKMDPKDFYTALSASASLPLLAKPVNVAGEKCLDGGPAAAVPFHKPFEDGYEKAVPPSSLPNSKRDLTSITRIWTNSLGSSLKARFSSSNQTGLPTSPSPKRTRRSWSRFMKKAKQSPSACSRN